MQAIALRPLASDYQTDAPEWLSTREDMCRAIGPTARLRTVVLVVAPVSPIRCTGLPTMGVLYAHELLDYHKHENS